MHGAPISSMLLVHFMNSIFYLFIESLFCHRHATEYVLVYIYIYIYIYISWILFTFFLSHQESLLHDILAPGYFGQPYNMTILKQWKWVNLISSLPWSKEGNFTFFGQPMTRDWWLLLEPWHVTYHFSIFFPEMTEIMKIIFGHYMWKYGPWYWIRP